jgi:hypothetical protein
MKSRTALAAGIACLLAAQLLASFAIKPLRAATVAAGETYTALKPGEFAGTLLLGGFRGLACDLLWMRATAAKENRRFFESVALFQAISRIQPRFEQIWEYMSWDMAYNIAVEVDDPAAKFGWFVAGLDANVRGCRRNPGSERLLRHLAWMYHHKGDTFPERVLATDWAPLLNPLLDELDQRMGGEPLERLPPGPGLSNFQLSDRIYRVALRVAAHEGKHPPAFVRRMVPLAVEKDGNQLRNRGEHRAALQRWLDALDAWERVRAWIVAPDTSEQDTVDKGLSIDSTQRNEGRLRRKAMALARELAPDAATAESAATALATGRYADARALIAAPGWKDVAQRSGVRWLDQP